MIQSTKLKKIFHDQGVQINTDAVNFIDDHVRRMVVRWAKKCKAGNVKRLTSDLVWVMFDTRFKDYRRITKWE